MASMKARKGNPFEYDTAYSLKEGGYTVERMDDNTAGIDLIVRTKDETVEYYVECKNRQGLSWNALVKIYEKTEQTMRENNLHGLCRVVFKSNRQPVLVMWKPAGRDYIITTFNDAFLCHWSKRPKGFKLWR
jgi:hypothetical protein